jgi:hypothetical protein
MQAKQIEESPFFIGQSTLTLFNQAPQNVETKIEFPRSEFHRQMANKRKEGYF